jgi:hypothetical protein
MTTDLRATLVLDAIRSSLAAVATARGARSLTTDLRDPAVQDEGARNATQILMFTPGLECLTEEWRPAERRENAVLAVRLAADERLLAARGTADQRDRWRARTLTENEMMVLAREVAFMTCEGLPRYVRFEHDRGDGSTPRNPLPHAPGCAKPTPDFYVAEVPAHQWASKDALRHLLNAIERALSTWVALELGDFTDARVTVRLHTGRCPGCNAKIERVGGLVEVAWAGRTLSREYAL